MNVVDKTHVSALQADPTNRTLNTHNTQISSEPARRLAFDRFAAYSFETQEFQLAALDEWEFDGETVTLTFREDLSWSDGSDVTTEDIDVQFQILEKIGSAIWGYVESTEVVDDYTYQLNLTGPTNPVMVKHQLGNMWIDTPAAAFEQFLDADASEIQTWNWEDSDTEVITSGAWAYVDKNQQQWNFERNEEFHSIDNVNFSDFQFDSYQEASVPQQDFTTGGKRFDSQWSMFAAPETVNAFQDYVMEIQTIPAKWGYGMIFNHDDPIFGDRAVRQAIAHVVNREELVANAGPRTKFPASVPCGIAPRDIEGWLGDTQSNFEDYGVGSTNTEEATQLLEDAGYSMQNGTWTSPDGEPISADYLTPGGWTDFTTMTETIVDRLNEFGFDLSVASRPTSDWQGAFIESNFKVGTFYWLPGQARSSFPYFPLRHQLALAALNGGHNYDAESEQTIPAMSGDGEMTINPLAKVDEIATKATNEEAMSVVQEAAWHNNYDLPMLSLVSKFEQSWLTTDEWNVDLQEGDPERGIKWPPFWLPRTGKLTAQE
ncbi:extracellular solute-binding protein family 5 [Halosimplex carlsbadense 2-9-1]|uniref:Extracellular solute-binding protein family 5 n=2 Tax=Halosimplex carlsbadense TaxID=171164 RepID=M0CWU4_9EURY|nr:extracellular solute-binding protein family 5 [Halosimplex carlsbadense 2-9-1]